MPEIDIEQAMTQHVNRISDILYEDITYFAAGKLVPKL